MEVVKIWKEAIENFPEIEEPTLHGWVTGDDGLEPIWSSNQILPTELVDMIEERGESEEEGTSYVSDISDDSDLDYS